MRPDVVIRPILPALRSVNQSAPSGPVTMFSGPLPAVAVGKVRSRRVRGSIRPM
jgi:hypothetical protein